MQNHESIADTWGREYGELLNKTQIAKMLGVSLKTIQRRVDQGKYRTNGDGTRVFTRSVAIYEETGIPQGKPKPISRSAPNYLRKTCKYRIVD